MPTYVVKDGVVLYGNLCTTCNKFVSERKDCRHGTCKKVQVKQFAYCSDCKICFLLQKDARSVCFDCGGGKVLERKVESWGTLDVSDEYGKWEDLEKFFSEGTVQTVKEINVQNVVSKRMVEFEKLCNKLPEVVTVPSYDEWYKIVQEYEKFKGDMQQLSGFLHDEAKDCKEWKEFVKIDAELGRRIEFWSDFVTEKSKEVVDAIEVVQE